MCVAPLHVQLDALYPVLGICLPFVNNEFCDPKTLKSFRPFMSQYPDDNRKFRRTQNGVLNDITHSYVRKSEGLVS
jgi:hypothetical protein